MLNNKKTICSSFKDLNIKPAILSLLEKNGLETPTPIQAKAIPVAILGNDLLGIAQTGTGKTLAFGIPVVQRLLQNKSKALILLPTRELATQVEESLRKICLNSGLRTVSLIGGEPINRQIYSLKYNPRIIIATPGRLLDHYKRRTINLENISILVLDEADMMFDLGFAPQIEEIIKLTPTNRQTLLFSATMPAPIIKLAEKYLKSPLQIEVAPAGTTAELVDQEIYLVHQNDRLNTLKKILLDYKNLVLIFVRTKHGASNLTEKLKNEGHQVSEIHSNLSFNQRKVSLASFKNGTKRILVATDVAARGLDIKDIELVLNFDLPDNSEDYVHRIGRTARAGKGGKAISFALPHQRREIQKIERLIRKNLPLLKIGSLQSEPENIKQRIERFPYAKQRSNSFSQNRSFDRGNYSKSRDFNRNKTAGSRTSFSKERVFGKNNFSKTNSSDPYEGKKFAQDKPFKSRKTTYSKFADSDKKSFSKTPIKRGVFSKFKGPEKNDFSKFKSSGRETREMFSDKSFGRKNREVFGKKSSNIETREIFSDKSSSSRPSNKAYKDKGFRGGKTKSSGNYKKLGFRGKSVYPKKKF